MKPEHASDILLGTARARAKMHEYQVPESDFNRIPKNPAQLFALTIGMIGDVAASTIAGQSTSERLAETNRHLLFCARFFDSYVESRLDAEHDSYVLLLASTTYYLAQLPGSAAVIASRLPVPFPDLKVHGLEQLLSWVLTAHFHRGPIFPPDAYEGGQQVASFLATFFSSGTGAEELLRAVKTLRRSVYDMGTARELLFADLVGAVVHSRYANSTWSTLPRYSELSDQLWAPILQKDSFVSELWPAQQLLGDRGLYRGTSAVVQMPTSAGKTRALDLVIRGSFYSDRTSLAVIVAPFRALCQEIRQSLTRTFSGEAISVDELSDVQNADFNLTEFLSRKQILIMTPEKCLYLIRHSPDIAANLGLLVYDEGHQFDSGRRGVTYELLLTALKSAVPPGTQTILVSAVLSNAQAIADWLLGAGSTVVSGANLLPTTRALAFVSWRDLLGRLEFTQPSNPDEGEFFVPRLIEQHTLQLLGREVKPRVFPERTSTSIGLYLALKVGGSGAVAVFVGTKVIASSLINEVVEVYRRGFSLPLPVDYSSAEEVQRLSQQNASNLGEGAASTAAARMGIFCHHGNTPHGIRLAVEHAMKDGLIRMVICTSTLAQGVNLPIRYLIITGAQQGRNPIKTRDFHNLLGRAGRSGMHTEGTVIFSDPRIYDGRANFKERWRWPLTKALLDPSKAEECKSTLLSVLDPVDSVDRKQTLMLSVPTMIAAHVSGMNGWRRLAQRLLKKYPEGRFDGADLLNQLTTKSDTLSAIESFLMAHWDGEAGDTQASVESLVDSTLAFHLATAEQRLRLVELFEELAQNISSKIPETATRRAFSRSLFGVAENIYIRAWVEENGDTLIARTNTSDLLGDIWPLTRALVRNSLFTRCSPPEPLRTLAEQWVLGKAFSSLLGDLVAADCRFGDKLPRRPVVENIVDICENGFGFEGMLIIGAVAEAVTMIRPEETNSILLLRELQSQIKYGLASSTAITLYELGFADRVIAQELAITLGGAGSRRKVIRRIRTREKAIRAILSQYPTYFTAVLDSVLSQGQPGPTAT